MYTAAQVMGCIFGHSFYTRSAGLDRAAAASRAGFDVLETTATTSQVDSSNAVDATARTTVLLMVLVQGGGRGSGRGSEQEAARLPRGREGLRRRPVEGLLQEAAHELEVVDRDAVQRRRVIGRARRRVVGRVRVGHGHR